MEKKQKDFPDVAADFDDGCHCCGNGCDVLVF